MQQLPFSSSGLLTRSDGGCGRHGDIRALRLQPLVLLQLMFQSSLLEPLKENTIKS